MVVKERNAIRSRLGWRFRIHVDNGQKSELACKAKVALQQFSWFMVFSSQFLEGEAQVEDQKEGVN